MKKTSTKATATTLTTDDPRHGRYSSYTNYGCRCDQCRNARREYYVDYEARRRSRTMPQEERMGIKRTALKRMVRVGEPSPSAVEVRLARAGQVVSPVVRWVADEQPSRRLHLSAQTIAGLYELARLSPLSAQEANEVIIAVLRTPLHRGGLHPDWEKLVAGWAVGHPVEHRAMVSLARDLLYMIDK